MSRKTNRLRSRLIRAEKRTTKEVDKIQAAINGRRSVKVVVQGPKGMGFEFCNSVIMAIELGASGEIVLRVKAMEATSTTTHRDLHRFEDM